MTVIDLDDAAVAAAGGKARVLATLRGAGVHVPDGFVIPTTEYLRHLPNGAPTDPVEIVRSTRLAPVLIDAIRAALARLFGTPDGGHVAVRSSATDEDGVDSSAAGQHDSFLAVRGTDAVAAAIVRCWASLWTDRAHAYHHTRRNEPPAMAVLVQRFVDADASGVMFTGSPRVIEATVGLGEELVGGRVTPDTWTIDDAGIVDRRRGSIDHRSDRQGDHIVRRGVPATNHMCLSDAQVGTLGRVGSRISEVLAGPSDIEWAIDQGVIHVLQARPITATLPTVRTVARTEAFGDRLWGIAASPGRVTGTVRVVNSPDDFRHVGQGDILLCRTSDPAWTPLFRIVAGVITETGGLLSHAAIVARELRIPAVVAVSDATRVLRPGAIVTIDGGRGTVTVR